MAGAVRVAGCLVGAVVIGQSLSARAAPVCTTDPSGNVYCSGGAITSPITVYDAAAAFQPINGSNSYTPANPAFPATGYNPSPPTTTVTIDGTASFTVTTNSTAALADRGLIVANFSNDEDPAVNNVVINNAGLISLTTSQIATSRMHDVVSDSQVNNFTVNNTGTLAITQNFFGGAFNAGSLGVMGSGSPATYAAQYGGVALDVMSAMYSDDNTNEFIINNSGAVTASGNYAAAYYGRADTTITNSATIANTGWSAADTIATGHWAIATWAGADFEALPGTSPDSPFNVVSNIVNNGGVLQGTIAVTDTSATTITNNTSGVIKGDILALDITPTVYAAGIASSATFLLAISGTNAGPRDSNIENYGLINGNIYLGSGTHVIDNAAGATLNGSINVDQSPSIASFSVAKIYSTDPSLNGTPLNGEPAPNQLYLSASGVDFAGNACPASGQPTSNAGCAQSVKVLATFVGGQSLTLTNEGTLNGDIIINDQRSSVNSITLTGTGFAGNVIALNGSGSNSLTLIGVTNLASVQNFSAVDLQTSQVTITNGISLVDGATLATTIFGSGGTMQSPSTNLGTITGTLTFQSAGTIVPTIVSILHNGDVFQVASSVSGSSISVDNSSALVNFTADTSTGALLLKSSVLPVTAVPGLSSAGTNTLNTLLSYQGSNPALQALGGAVESLGSFGDVRTAGEQLRPSVNGASIMVPLSVASLFQSQLSDRIDSLLFGNTPMQQAMLASPALGYAGPPLVGKAPNKFDDAFGATFWGNLVGSKVDQQAIGPIAGYSASTGGLIGGADALLTNDIRVGGAFGYATSAISDHTSVGNTIGLDTYEGLLYATLVRPSWFVDASLGYGFQDYITSRRIVFPGFSDVATGEHTGNLYLARIDGGIPVSFGSLTAVPVASLDWAHLDQSAYSEASMAGAGLNIDAQHNDSVRSEIGIKSYLSIASGPSFAAVVGAHLEWMHEFGNPAQAVTAGFVGGGGDFFAAGPAPVRDMADVGAELALASLGGGESLTLSYSAMLGGSFVDQTAMLRARVPFDAGLDAPNGAGSRREASNTAWTLPALSFDIGATAAKDSPWAQLAMAPGGLYDQAQDAGASATLPEIRIVPAAPLAPPRRAPAPAAAAPVVAENAPAQAEPGVIDRDKVPANIQTMSAADFDPTVALGLLDALSRGVPGSALSDQTGNEFLRDFNYRGFIASPVIGTPQGLAVYQNGVRINEVFGDIVNWDFIPQNAINRMTLAPSNPVYGLNALGGALSFEMKNGFTYHGVEGEVSGGSYGRIGGTAQAGGQVGNLSGYITADVIHDDGWRLDSPSDVRRVYADVGARGDDTEFHVSFTGASNKFGAAAATPIEMLNQDWSSIYTVPQTTANQLAFLTTSASWKPTDTLAFQANAYYRGYWQQHVDGNGTDAQNDGCPDPTVLCFPNLDGTLSNLTTIGGGTVPATGALATSVLGEIDRTWTSTNSFGGSVQAASSHDVFGHGNNFVIGASVDRGLVQFTTTSELGTINADQFPSVQGFGIFIDQPSGDVAPVQLGARTLYTGLYTSDTFDITPRLSVTAGGRYNVAEVTLQDELGNDPGLNASHTYSRFNPVVGATYKLTPNVNVYASYAEANRAPTPLELACADPLRPCLIDNALVGDPDLKQVVSHTVEAGLRGHLDLARGLLNWSFGAFHTLNTDDIINVASPIPGHEFFQNGGDTLRKGIEADLSYKWDRWNVYANYTFVDATFQDALTLSSPNNPFADANGNIFVVPGDHLTGVPDYRFKLGAEYQVTDPWKVGADLNITGSQYLVGDESNQNPKVPAYWTVNLHSSYQFTKNVELYGVVKNLFDRHYYVYGTFFETDSFPYLNLTDPRTFVPGVPFIAYAGLRAKL